MEYEMTMEQLRRQCESQIKSYEESIARYRAVNYSGRKDEDIAELGGKIEALKNVLWWTRPKE